MPLIIGNIIGIPTYSLGGVRLPSCVQDIAISWYKNLDAPIDSDIDLTVINFDSIDDRINYPSIPNINQDQKLTFKMYVDNESGYYGTTGGNCLLSIADFTNDAYFYVGLKGSSFYVTTDAALGQHQSSLSGISGQIIDVEILKSDGGGFWQVDSVKFNGVTIPSTGNNLFSTTSDTFDIGSIGNSFNLVDATIWDIKLYDSTSTLIHHWLGEGENVTSDSAWEDQVGSLDGTVLGNPDARNILSSESIIQDQQGSETRNIYYGQYLTNSSGQINFYRTSEDNFDYIDPSDGSFIEGEIIPATGLYTIPANGICNIGVYPRIVDVAAYGVLDFDGLNDYVELTSTPDASGSKVLTFSLNLNKVTGFPTVANGSGLICFNVSSSSEYICIFLKGDEFLVYVSALPLVNTRYTIPTSILNKPIEVILTKTATAITSFSVDGINLVGTSDVPGTNFSTNYKYIGTDGTIELEDAQIWDINLNDEHFWAGNPEGNLDSSWVDSTYVNSTIIGSPTIRTIVDGLTTVEEVMLGVTGGDYVEFTDNPTIAGDKNIQFKLYLDNSSGYNFDGVVSFVNSDSDHFRIFVDSASIYFFHNNDLSPYNRYYDISTLDSQILEFSITKDATEFTDISLNGSTITTLPYTGGISSSAFSGIYTFGFNGTTGDNLSVWDVEIYDDPAGTNTLIHSWSGYPDGNTADAWKDTVVNYDGTVYGSPTTTDVEEEITPETVTYTSYYPCVERAGTVLHDIMENAVHISVSTPTWNETLYGSDYLNQKGYVTKTDSDALGYDWETIVNGSDATLNDNTLIPLAQWNYVDLQDKNGVNLLDENDEQLQVRVNI